jgi:hypothetical protein
LKISPIFSKFLEIGRYPLPLRASYIPTVQKNRTLVQREPPSFYKGAVNAYFLTDSFSKKTVVFEAAIFVGQPEDGVEVRCDVLRRIKHAVSRYSGPSAQALQYPSELGDLNLFTAAK